MKKVNAKKRLLTCSNIKEIVEKKIGKNSKYSFDFSHCDQFWIIESQKYMDLTGSGSATLALRLPIFFWNAGFLS